MIARARLIASAWLSVCAHAREAPDVFTSHPPSLFGTTHLLLSLLMFRLPTLLVPRRVALATGKRTGGIVARTHTLRMHTLHTKFRAECEKTNTPCWVCEGAKPIVHGAKHNDYRNDDRFQLDHYFPVSTHPHLQEDRTNFRANHAGCSAFATRETCPLYWLRLVEVVVLFCE